MAKAPKPDETAIHIVLDNYATHKSPAIQRWLVHHHENHAHLTPSSTTRLKTKSSGYSRT